MKKLLLIIAAVICVAIAGSALAVTYYDAANVAGTVTTDSYLVLSFDGSSTATALNLDESAPCYYTICCKVDKSATPTANGTFTLQLADGENTNLDDVTVTLYSDSNCVTPVSGKTQTGAGTITISGITETTTYYAKITLSEGHTQEQLGLVGGELVLNFVQA